MKFQFQFAGVNMDRPVPQQQRRKRWMIFGLTLALLCVCYWQYLHYLSHGSFFFIQIRKVTPVTAVKSAAPKPAQPESTPAAAAAPIDNQKENQKSDVKSSVVDGPIASVWNHIVEAVKSPVAKETPSQTPATPETAADPATVAVVSPSTLAPRIHKPKAPETAEQRLARAGKKALDIMLGSASKNPDAYGFTAEDVFAETKLGEPILVYNIAEKDRAAYQQGQSVEGLLKPANQWVFPVYAGERMCCMVQVTFNGHEYIPGSATKFLALAWNKIAERWPVTDGFHPRLIINPDISGYYFTIPELDTPNITDTFQMFTLHPSLSPADVILASWR